jgi:CRP-like cAMP-binding protein
VLHSTLGSLALFRGCSGRQLRRIGRLGTMVEVGPGRVLCDEGAIGAEFFVIVRGYAVVQRRGYRIARLRVGQAFGEVALLSRDRVPRRTASVIAAEPMTLLVFNRPEFNTLIREVPVVARRLLESVSNVALFFAEGAPNARPHLRLESGGGDGEGGTGLAVSAQ